MAQRGRKAQPKTVIQPGPMPDPPDWLQGEDSLALWHRYGPTLNALGLLESLDAVTFALLCDAYEALLQQRIELATVPLVVAVGENGAEQQHPLVGIVRQQVKSLQGLLSEFGMTPSSRTSLTGSTSTKPIQADIDPLEELMKQVGDMAPATDPQPTTPRKRRKAAKKKPARKTPPKKRAAKKKPPARKKTTKRKPARKARS